MNMIHPHITLLLIYLVISINIIRIIEKISVEGWEDEEGFHLGREDESDSR